MVFHLRESRVSVPEASPGAPCRPQRSRSYGSALLFRGGRPSVQALLEEGAFREVRVQRVSKMTHFASPEEFTRAILIGGVMRRTGTQFSEETIQLLIDDVSADLQSYVSADGLSVPMEAHIATARK